jgi:hypothetical protein
MVVDSLKRRHFHRAECCCAVQVIEELNARTQLLQELQQRGGAAAAEQSRLVKAEIQQQVMELRRLGVAAGEP